MLESFLGPENARLPIAKIIITRSGHPRAAATDVLLEQVRTVRSEDHVDVHSDMAAALDDALAWAGPEDVICVTGSIFVVALARRVWAERYPERFAPDDWVFEDESEVAIVSDAMPELEIAP
jgi:folylpolyglutamate synthase/dihydropteroate synthase